MSVYIFILYTRLKTNEHYVDIMLQLRSNNNALTVVLIEILLWLEKVGVTAENDVGKSPHVAIIVAVVALMVAAGYGKLPLEITFCC